MQVPYSPTPARLGPYELLQKLATGGMAEIYIARREGPHGFSKRIALKRILPQLAADPEFVAMFIDEARLCAQLTHPNLVQVFDFGEEAGELYMAMELVEGTTAAKVARAAASRGEPVPTEVALQIALSVGRGLAHAHEASDDQGRPLGLVHRDVSPGNILISGSGAVKLGDFGIARAAEFERRTDQGQLKGKLGYMSPEQVTGRELDAKSDQFTAAIVLAELLTARPLFSGPREMDVLVKIRDADISVLERYGRHVPADLMVVLRRALSRRREDRFPTTGAYVDGLDEVTRRRRLGATPAILVDWLNRTGLAKTTGKSGEHMISGAAPGGSLPRIETPKVGGEPSLAVKPSGAQAIFRRSIERTGESVPPTDTYPGVYRVKHPEVPRPVSLPDLLNLLASGRITGDTLVARDDGTYRPLREIVELSRPVLHGKSNAGAVDDTPANTPSVVTPFRPGDLPGRLFALNVRRATGLLLVKNGELEKKVYFTDGVPAVTSSTDEKELLGSLLVSRGLALPMEIEMGLALAPRYGGRLGDALVGLGVLRPVELVRAIVDQMRRRFVELVGWKHGHLSFTHGALCRDEDMMPEAFNAVELVARGIVEGYGYDDLSKILAPIEGALIVPVPRAAISVASLKLAAREAAVLESINGQQTLGQIASEAVLRGTSDREGTLRAVFVGLSSKAFLSPGWPPSSHRETLPTVPL